MGRLQLFDFDLENTEVRVVYIVVRGPFEKLHYSKNVPH